MNLTQGMATQRLSCLTPTARSLLALTMHDATEVLGGFAVS